MKKIVFLSLFALCLPLGMMAQSNDDDLYFNPSKDKEEPAPVKKAPVKREVTTNIYTTPGTTVVVQDRKGNTRDVDEYNRRYDSRDNEFSLEDDTIYIKEKSQPDLDGEWVNGEFNGSPDDYEYAERIIRFRNPRYAISVSSPLYWDVMYGMNSWDWNVYSDGLYAYAFPTFTNRLWWDWRFNSFGGGWGFGFGSPYYSWGGYPGYWGGGYGGWYGGGWGGHWGHHHHGGYYPGWGGGGGSHWANNTTYTNRRSYGSTGTTTNRRSDATRSQTRRTGTVSSDRRSSATEGTRRVVGTRSSSSRTGVSRDEGTSSRRSTYTRPSSTRSSGDGERMNSVRSSSRDANSSVSRGSSTRSSSSYSRGSSTSPSRSTGESTRRSYDSNNNSSSRSSSPSSSSSSRSSGSYSGGSSSSRSSSSGSSSSSGGGGGSSRSSRR